MMNLQKIRAAVVPGGTAILLFFSASAGLAADSDGPLVLSNEHLGMSHEELAPPLVEELAPPLVEDVAPVVEQALPETPGPVVSEVVAEPEEAAEPAVLAAAPEGGAVTYELCMERAIRAGIAYDTSHKVCRAVFQSLW